MPGMEPTVVVDDVDTCECGGGRFLVALHMNPTEGIRTYSLRSGVKMMRVLYKSFDCVSCGLRQDASPVMMPKFTRVKNPVRESVVRSLRMKVTPLI